MTEIETIEKETDEHVSKSLGVWPLHKRIDLLEKRISVLREEFEEALRAHDKRLLAHRERLNALDERVVALKKRADGHVRRMDYLDEKDVDLSTRIAQQKERHGFLVGEHVNGYDRLRGWMYALAGSQGAARARPAGPCREDGCGERPARTARPTSPSRATTATSAWIPGPVMDRIIDHLRWVSVATATAPAGLRCREAGRRAGGGDTMTERAWTTARHDRLEEWVEELQKRHIRFADTLGRQGARIDKLTEQIASLDEDIGLIVANLALVVERIEKLEKAS